MWLYSERRESVYTELMLLACDRGGAMADGGQLKGGLSPSTRAGFAGPDIK